MKIIVDNAPEISMAETDLATIRMGLLFRLNKFMKDWEQVEKDIVSGEIIQIHPLLEPWKVRLSFNDQSGDWVFTPYSTSPAPALSVCIGEWDSEAIGSNELLLLYNPRGSGHENVVDQIMGLAHSIGVKQKRSPRRSYAEWLEILDDHLKIQTSQSSIYRIAAEKIEADDSAIKPDKFNAKKALIGKRLAELQTLLYPKQ